MKYKTIKTISKLATALITIVTSQSATAFYSVSIEAPELSYFNYFNVGAASFNRPISEYSEFWNFCEPSNCGGFGVEALSQEQSYSAGMSLDSPGSVYAHQANLSYFPYVDTEVLAFPVKPDRPTGKVVFNINATEDNVAQILPNTSVGFVLRESWSVYSFPGQTGNQQLKFLTTFDESLIPSGYIANVSTVVEARIYASWFIDEGSPAFLDKLVLSETVVGSGELDIYLPLGFAAYPEMGDTSYATYSVEALHQVTFAQAVPEPETYALFIAGLGLIGFIARHRRPAKV